MGSRVPAEMPATMKQAMNCAYVALNARATKETRYSTLDTGSNIDEPYKSKSTPTGELKKQARKPNMEGIHDILGADSACS